MSYIETLSPREKSEVVDTGSSAVFNFRKMGNVESSRKLVIPLEEHIKIEVEVVDKNIPLLLSRAALKRPEFA